MRDSHPIQVLESIEQMLKNGSAHFGFERFAHRNVLEKLAVKGVFEHNYWFFNLNVIGVSDNGLRIRLNHMNNVLMRQKFEKLGLFVEWFGLKSSKIEHLGRV